MEPEKGKNLFIYFSVFSFIGVNGWWREIKLHIYISSIIRIREIFYFILKQFKFFKFSHVGNIASGKFWWGFWLLFGNYCSFKKIPKVGRCSLFDTGKIYLSFNFNKSRMIWKVHNLTFQVFSLMSKQAI